MKIIIAATAALALALTLGLLFGVAGEDQLRAIGADMAKQHGYLTGRK